jgi:pimeloyl-ACP methyl ester carboxylesterase
MTINTDRVENEFAELASTAPALTVARRWVNVVTGGHVSGVVWGRAAPELVLLHDVGSSARSWDAVLVALGRPAVAIDLPGHGRSNDNPGGDNGPVRAARPVIEAIRSFAPRHRAVVGRGLGALVALAAAGRAPAAVGRLVLVDTLPDVDAPEDERLWTRLAELAHPPLLVRAGHGALSDAAVARLRRQSPQATVVVLTDASHDIETDQPEALADLLAPALTREETVQ